MISPVAQLENEEAVQVSLMTVIDSILKGTIELKRAQLIVRALSIAQRNARYTRFQSCASDMVRQIPEQTVLATATHPTESCHPEHSEEPAVSPSKEPAAPGDTAAPIAKNASDLAPRKKPCHSEKRSDEESALAKQHLETTAFTPAQQRELDEINRARAGAQRGNLEDFKTILGVAGLLDSDGHL